MDVSSDSIKHITQCMGLSIALRISKITRVKAQILLLPPFNLSPIYIKSESNFQIFHCETIVSLENGGKGANFSNAVTGWGWSALSQPHNAYRLRSFEVQGDGDCLALKILFHSFRSQISALPRLLESSKRCLRRRHIASDLCHFSADKSYIGCLCKMHSLQFAKQVYFSAF